MKKVLISTGDVSGDLHVAGVIRAVRKRDPSIEFFGLGGARMKEAGFRPLWDSSGLSVVGLTEVAEKFFSLARAYRLLRRSLDTERPNLVMLVDFPDFNLFLAGAAKKRGIPVLYFISPQVWAWRGGRIKKIARCVDRMAVILPFEVPFYEKAGVRVDYVGHPLLERMPSPDMGKFFSVTGLNEKKRIITLLPGSRSKEVERSSPVLLDTAEILRKKMPDLQFVMPLAPGFPSNEGKGEVRVIHGMVAEALHASILAIVASGTITLEAALAGTPMVIIYKLSPISYWLARLLVSVKDMGLVNLIAGRRIVPELVQSDVSPERIAEEAHRIISDEAMCLKIKEDLKAAVSALSEPIGQTGASSRVADIILSMI